MKKNERNWEMRERANEKWKTPRLKLKSKQIKNFWRIKERKNGISLEIMASLAFSKCILPQG